MIFMFPTVMYATGNAVRIIIRRGSGHPETGARERVNDRKRFELTLLSECLMLNLLNGLIIAFGVGQVAFGIAVIVAGVMVSVFGISSLFTETELVRELFLTISNIIILGELVDFASFSYLASTGLIVGLVALLFYYTLRITGESGTPAV